MSHYPTSTQKNKWSFDAPTLALRRQESNNRAIENVRESYRLAVENGSHTNAQSATEPECGPPTVEEEGKIRKYYEKQLLALCSSFQFPHKVHGTAMTYFKRFYVKNSLIEHHPKGIMLTCIYLACKCEENYISMEQFARGASQNLKEILNKELPVLHHLDFELITFTPYRSIIGLMLNLNDKLTEPIPEETTAAVLASAQAYVDELMLTDAPLTFPPSQLALVALSTACYQHQLPQAHAKLKDDAFKAAAEQSVALEENLELLERMRCEGATPINEEEVRNIDLKLKLWKTLTGDDKDRDKKRLKNNPT
mmetsp:Transcript_34122/g.57336  ORF Transcript_34122/g.57336 Transcript_34122/m.57336 type:complete len:310 (+) Transcript_34122:141-1070(+)|eukprot:CAMPEP_0198222644 /NCGR_PEP_ID=MMETSP1445-20131203/88999_1 /TAXON_ID=36898 /ORGANISM="Pyramimonas sp., Strain CCMP2087" /LENGTH=309 /DNA_ID=CAMNT_0043901219 /DNA_START=144 /DNA_END=1073 /DNA_ORIENTATION=-